MSIRGCDISNFQGNPNFQAASSGVDFVIIKATEGVGFKDPTFDSNESAIRARGLGLGFYHFARPDLGNSPEQEADFFLSVVSPKEGEILALDYEVNFNDPVSWCKSFLDRVNATLGCKPLIYLNLSLVRSYDWTAVINAGYGLWLADYDGVDNDAPDTPWPLVALKQWSSTGSVPGISGNVDLDTFFGDLAAFRAYGYHPIPTPPSGNGQPPVIETDQTLTHFPAPWGTMEKQATLSILNDQANDILRLEKDKDNLTKSISVYQTEMADINSQIITLKAALSEKPARLDLSQVPLSILFKELVKHLTGS